MAAGWRRAAAIMKVATGATKKTKGVERKQSNGQERRIVILDQEKCKPKSAAFVYLQKHAGGCGNACIEVVRGADRPRVQISEDACAACMLRASHCPDAAVTTVRLPTDLDKNTTHRYGQNQFKLCGLPAPSYGKVLGILGANGTGKTLALRILSGQLKPNLGHFDDPPGWAEIVQYYRGSSLQGYFEQVANDELRVAIKPQEPRFKPGTGRTVATLLASHDERGAVPSLIKELDLSSILDRELDALSGGERQRVVVACTAAKDAECYIFDEPCNFLDTKQRMAVVQVVRALCGDTKYVITVEHDITILDAISDTVCCLFGAPGAYGVCTQGIAPARAINQYLAGYFPQINMRFRPEALNFAAPAEREVYSDGKPVLEYESMEISHGSAAEGFKLQVAAGEVRRGEVLGLLGQNGCGKSTLLQHLAASQESRVSHKPQHLNHLRDRGGTVAALLEAEVGESLGDRMFSLCVLQPLQIKKLSSKRLRDLSGGELQRVAIVCCVGKVADLYLLDEPSAGLDCEQRLLAANVLQRWVGAHLQKTAIVIEHDLLIAATLFHRVISYTGTPGSECKAATPSGLDDGLNSFLRELGVTVREDSANGRPRLNKYGGTKDREQKKEGHFYLRKAE